MKLYLTLEDDEGQKVDRMSMLNEGMWEEHIVRFISSMMDSLQESKLPL